MRKDEKYEILAGSTNELLECFVYNCLFLSDLKLQVLWLSFFFRDFSLCSPPQKFKRRSGPLLIVIIIEKSEWILCFYLCHFNDKSRRGEHFWLMSIVVAVVRLPP
jgi:hypothetical protein